MEEEKKKEDDLSEFQGTARSGRRNALAEDQEGLEEIANKEVIKQLESLTVEETKEAEKT